MEGFTNILDATSGSCGDNVAWSYKESTGTLTISGTGAMNNFVGGNNGGGHEDSYYVSHPWYSFRDKIQRVVIESGVTSIGDYAFFGCMSLKSIVIPEGVESIGSRTFMKCAALKEVVLPSTLKTIGSSVFRWFYPETVVSHLAEPIEIDEWTFSPDDGVNGPETSPATLYIPIGTKSKLQEHAERYV